MLAATLGGASVRARRGMPRGDHYACPECDQPVTLKAGQQLAAHFAHRAKAGCDWGAGESADHMLIKGLVCDFL